MGAIASRLSAMGQDAASRMGDIITRGGSRQADLLRAIAEARAQGDIAKANLLSQMVTQLGQIPQQVVGFQDMMRKRKMEEEKFQLEKELAPLEKARIIAQTEASGAAKRKSEADVGLAEKKANEAREEAQIKKFSEIMATSEDQKSYRLNLQLAAEQGLIPPEHYQRMQGVQFTPEMKSRFQEKAMGTEKFVSEQRAATTAAATAKYRKAMLEKPGAFLEGYYAAKEQEPGLTIKEYQERQKTATENKPDEYEKAVAEGWKGTRAEWKTLVADTYATGWTAMTTPDGRTLWVHKSTGQTSYSPPGTRPQFTAAERMQLSDIDELIGRSDRLLEIADRNRGSIGYVQGKLSAAKRNVIGSSDEVNEMFRIADNMADILLRARSGAQINEQEYKRLRTLVPNPRLAEAKFFSDLKLFKEELQRIQGRRSGATPLITPEGGTTQPQGGGAAPPSDPLGIF